jgi:hypothetical protein
MTGLTGLNGMRSQAVEEIVIDMQDDSQGLYVMTCMNQILPQVDTRYGMDLSHRPLIGNNRLSQTNLSTAVSSRGCQITCRQ